MTANRLFLEDAFPFLLEVDEDLRIRYSGVLMRRVLPQAAPGEPLLGWFQMRGGAALFDRYAQLCALGRRSVVMHTRGADALVFKGEWYQPKEGQVLQFLGWPWIMETDDLAQWGLSLNDFPAHSPMGDLLLLLRSSRNTLADTRELAERLHQRSSELKRANRQLEQLAHFDALTQLPNRVLLADRLNQALMNAQRRTRGLAVIYLDLDGFKPINDLHGHEAGDLFLVALAQRLKEALREGDTLARMGGDEFVVVLGDLESPADCAPIVERLLQAARMPVMLGGGLLQVSASIGVTFYPQDCADADLLLRHADQAMYQAKQSGKNRSHVFDPAQDAAVVTRHEGQEQVRCAIEQGQLVLHYQPVVNLATHQVLGVEALVRWQHPIHGLLAPGHFLPTVAGHPLMISLGDWVLQAALEQLARWNAQGLHLSMSVNIDPLHLQSSPFVDRLSALLSHFASVRSGQLTLEVLESGALGDIDHAEAVLHACQRMGVPVALDDFGTGYSSLVTLKRLPAQTLKIDRSFVSGMLQGTDDHAIVQATLSLARAFGREVVAEGVESEAHVSALLALGCTRAQGFGIARPMPGAAIAPWVRQYGAG